MPSFFAFESLCNSFNHYCASMAEGQRRKKSEDRRAYLPVLATCQSGTLSMLSSKVNGPVAHAGIR